MAVAGCARPRQQKEVHSPSALLPFDKISWRDSASVGPLMKISSNCNGSFNSSTKDRAKIRQEEAGKIVVVDLYQSCFDLSPESYFSFFLQLQQLFQMQFSMLAKSICISKWLLKEAMAALQSQG